jgi:photosystem II stability/assembly factor-like uncharacterized protein
LRATPFLLAVLLAAAADPGVAAPRWVRATPFGGDLAAVAVAPSAPRVVYAMAFDRPLYASRDGGETWETRGNLFIDPFYRTELSVSPRDPETLYAFVDTIGLKKSRNGGRDWEDIAYWNNDLLGIAADRDEPGLLYAAAVSGLYRSRDGGETWGLSAFKDQFVDVVAADPRHPATYFAIVSDPASESPPVVWKSSNRGETWTRISSLDARFSIAVPPFVFDPARPDTLYLAGGDDYSPVLRSDDGGMTWIELVDSGVIRDLAVATDGTLIAMTNQFGVSRSTDRGETWMPPLASAPPAAPAPTDYLQQIVALSDPEGGLLAVGGEGVWKSTDSGASWRESNQGLVAFFAGSIVVPAAGPSVVLATVGEEVFRSTDQGGTWHRIHPYYDYASPGAITAIDPRVPETLYGVGSVADVDYPVASADGGVTWRQLLFPYADQCSGSLCYVTMGAFLLDPGEPDVLYAAGDYWLHYGPPPGPFLLRTTNGGATWETLTALPGLRSLLVLPGRASPLIATNRERLLKKEKSGGGWRRAGRGLPALGGGAALAADPRDPQRIYAGSAQGVFVSDDAGETFRPMNRGLETAKIHTILVDPLDSSRLYVTADKGYFRWNPGLRKWTPFNDGLPSLTGYEVLALDPRHPTRLYTGTSQGIFRIDLDGEDGPAPQPGS